MASSQICDSNSSCVNQNLTDAHISDIAHKDDNTTHIVNNQYNMDTSTPNNVHNQTQEITNKSNHINEYGPMHVGPFLVIVQSKEGNLGNLHPMKLGKLLYMNCDYNIQQIKKVNKNKLEVFFQNYNDANKFVKSNIGIQNNWHTFIPYSQTHVVGVIRGVDIELTNEEICKQIRTQEMYDVTQAYRFYRKHYNDKGEATFLPTQTVKITFKAPSLPKRAFLYFTTSEIETYNPPILQCKNCCKFGHYAKFCKNTLICPRCSENHTDKDCKSVLKKCPNCALPHTANSPECPLYKTQDHLRKKMTELKISYREATDLLQGKTSYAQLLIAKQNKPQAQTEHWKQDTHYYSHSLTQTQILTHSLTHSHKH